MSAATVAHTHRAPASGPADEAEGLHLDFERYWRQALLIKYWLLGIVVFALLASLVVTMLSTELYRATARIEISPTVENVTDTTPLEIEGRGGDVQFLNTQYELLESRFIAERVVDAGNLMRDEEFLTAFGLNERAVASPRVLHSLLRSNITITPIPQSTLVDISFSSPSPSVSARIANLWAQEYIAANYNKLFGANIEARDFLEEQIAELRERLALSERDLVDYATQKGIVIIGSGGEGEGSQTASQTLIGSELTALSEALAEATTDRIAAESALRAGSRGASESGSGGTTGLRAQLSSLEAELADL